MIAKLVLISVIIAVCSYYVNGTCPARESNKTVVVPNLKTNSEDLSNEIIESVVHKFLAWNDDIDFALTSDNPATSCWKIAEQRPSYVSGYYWIHGVSGAVKVYCEMGTNNSFGQSGGWMRIANVDMRNDQSQCPPGQLIYNVTEGRRLCRKPSLVSGCYSTSYI